VARLRSRRECIDGRPRLPRGTALNVLCFFCCWRLANVHDCGRLFVLRREGEHVGALRFLRLGVLVMPAALVLSLLALSLIVP